MIEVSEICHALIHQHCSSDQLHQRGDTIRRPSCSPELFIGLRIHRGAFSKAMTRDELSRTHWIVSSTAVRGFIHGSQRRGMTGFTGGTAVGVDHHADQGGSTLHEPPPRQVTRPLLVSSMPTRGSSGSQSLDCGTDGTSKIMLAYEPEGIAGSRAVNAVWCDGCVSSPHPS